MMAFIAWVTFAALNDRFTTVLMMLLYVSFMASFLFPSEYTVDERGIALKRAGISHFFPFERYRRGSRERGGLFLSPFRHARGLDGMRGVYLVMDKTHSDLLKQIVEEKILAGQPAGPADGPNTRI